jgi:hypothetical protein
MSTTDEALKTINKLLSFPMGEQTYAKEIKLLFEIISQERALTANTTFPNSVNNLSPEEFEQIVQSKTGISKDLERPGRVTV